LRAAALQRWPIPGCRADHGRVGEALRHDHLRRRARRRRGVCAGRITGSAKWAETVLHSFCAEKNCADGGLPYAGLFIDGSGNLYGTTSAANYQTDGTVFELTQSGTEWKVTVLHSFCSDPSCSDGKTPLAGVIRDASSGNLYGTTYLSGGCTFSGPCGTVFELQPEAR
jgi:hypothetical protein